MGHNSVVSGHPTSTSFSCNDGWSTDPWDLRHHKTLAEILIPPLYFDQTSFNNQESIKTKSGYIRQF